MFTVVLIHIGGKNAKNENINIPIILLCKVIAPIIYYFLHPTKGIKYVATWFNNKVSGIFINWHEDIVGSSDSNSVTGMTQYLQMYMLKINFATLQYHYLKN